ncbi:hypothetical protein vBVpaS1601_74 [Vibrio phage vB_VpaS_1601]|uniref:hypothetical protein n=1 Tax=Vibrio phage SHOU24 TaxID=1414739 RepID=UPI0003ED2148|nr:hypothetical protein SHOU24_07 [Vibrio phage SHOU24]AHI61204.1 hypothetical protein SHOU24_07 [Vibrio phage SHOU24]WHM52767.1 hypothetical protein vBVpaP1601_74 [Vibrio phage vB_VpaP_1601]
MLCYKLKSTGERLKLIRKRKQVSMFECIDRPMELCCSGVMAHPRIVVSDVRYTDVVEECKQ